MTVEVLPHRRGADRVASVPEPLTSTVRGRTVRAGGALDSTTVELVLDAARALLADGGEHVMLDLSAVTRIDSDAVSALFAAQLDVVPGTVLHLKVADRMRPRLAVCRLDGPALIGGQQRLVLAEAS